MYAIMSHVPLTPIPSWHALLAHTAVSAIASVWAITVLIIMALITFFGGVLVIITPVVITIAIDAIVTLDHPGVAVVCGATTMIVVPLTTPPILL
jgi:hypothetical protein